MNTYPKKLRDTFGMLIERRKGSMGIMVDELVDDLCDYHLGMTKDKFQSLYDVLEGMKKKVEFDRSDWSIECGGYDKAIFDIQAKLKERI